MKRLLALCLSLALALTVLPPISVRAAEKPSIRTVVEKEFDKLFDRVTPAESAYDGTFQLLNHALFGNGADLYMDESDAFTSLALHSNMYREAVITGVTAAIQDMLATYDTKLYVRGSIAWYEHAMRFSHTAVDSRDMEGTGLAANGNPLVPGVDYTGSRNAYDKAMILVGGGVTGKMILEQKQADRDSRTYHVTIMLEDIFDFDGDYSNSDNADLANALKWMGKLMELGAVINSFHWVMKLDFTVSVATECIHESRNFRWEFAGQEMSACSGDDLTRNRPEKILDTDAETGEQLDPYFRLEIPAKLRADQPWTVEFRLTGGGNFLLAPTEVTGGSPFLLKTYQVMVGGYVGVMEDLEKPKWVHNRYGIPYSALGVSINRPHTYRLENRIEPDGSNMVYLLIDGVDFGKMNHYFIYDGTLTDQNRQVDWFQGRNLDIRYVWNRSTRFSPSLNVEYIQIWENGDAGGITSYIHSQTVAPQPGVQGYTQYTCSQCGAAWKEDFVDALPGGIPGSWETDITLSAADLGVNTPDARLRCTLTFGSDGTVKADWKAMDLSAFREFYHTLFVNAYYACAYGAGMTDLAQVEQTCLESNGMSVSDYIYSFLDSFDINALFTPRDASGVYRTEGNQLYTDLELMGNPSDMEIPNSFALAGENLKWNAASYGLPAYTFHCVKTA